MEVTTIDIINLICQKLGIVATWTEEEAWPYIQALLQEVAVGRYSINKIMAFITGGLAICGLVLIILANILDAKTTYDAIGMYIIGWLILVPCLIACIALICSAIKWQTMPTVMGYEWLFNLIKGGSQ